ALLPCLRHPKDSVPHHASRPLPETACNDQRPQSHPSKSACPSPLQLPAATRCSQQGTSSTANHTSETLRSVFDESAQTVRRNSTRDLKQRSSIRRARR